MKNTRSRSAVQYAGVPLALFGGGVVFHALFRICGLFSIYPGSAGRAVPALILILAGMFLLRRVPKRRLVISSAAACGILLAAELLNIRLVEAYDPIIRAVVFFLDLFRSLPYNVLLPPTYILTGGAGAADPRAIYISVFVLEILLPMAYSFSGAFARLTGKKEEE